MLEIKRKKNIISCSYHFNKNAILLEFKWTYLNINICSELQWLNKLVERHRKMNMNFSRENFDKLKF